MQGGRSGGLHCVRVGFAGCGVMHAAGEGWGKQKQFGETRSGGGGATSVHFNRDPWPLLVLWENLEIWGAGSAGMSELCYTFWGNGHA